MDASRSKLGFQTQWDSGEGLLYNRVILPLAVMGINVIKVDWWRQIALDNPGVKRIYRHHPNSDALGLVQWINNPEGAAIDLVAFLRGHLLDTLDHIDLVTGDNEFILGPDHESPDRIDKADRFMAAFIREADSLLGRGVCVGNFNVGHWAGETVDYFPRTLTAIQTQASRGERLSYLCFHEYNWPLLRDDTHWYTGKFLRAMPPILERYPDIRCMVTEVGIDKASKVWGEHAGWRKAHDDIDIAVDIYCGDNGLAWYNDLLNQTDYVAAVLIFGCGMTDWRGMGFDIMNGPDDTAVLDHIKTYPVVAPPEPPPEPPNGDNMDIEIYDYNGDLQDWDWLKAEFGDVQVHPVEDEFSVREGEHIYKVCYLRAKSGDSACQINTKGLDGQNVVGETVIFGWADADPHGLVDNGHNWTGNGIPGLTNETGDVGPGMGAFYSPADGERGPYWCWVYGLPSDYVDGLGMLAMTNHNHVDVGYREVIASEGEPPEPPVDSDLLAAVKRIDKNVAEIKTWLLKTPPEPPEPPKPEVFRGEYFNNITLTGAPALVRDDKEINFEWGSGSPDPKVNPDHFSVRWTGKRTFAGPTVFHVLADDGVRLWVYGQLVIDQWHDQGPTHYEVRLPLTPGEWDIKVEYYERGGGSTIKLWWE